MAIFINKPTTNVTQDFSDAEKSTARSNIGAVSESDFENHKKDTSNPHEVTAGQTGAYTKSETEDRIAEATREIGGKKVVDVLPELSDADKRLTYLLVTDVEGVYEQYCVNDDKSAWIDLGSTQIDLSDYAKTEDVTAAINALDLVKVLPSVGRARIIIKKQ